jgi:predicted phage baseplate assembly protein
MALPVPKLDDRQFQDIVDEAKKRIPHYCQEWTDHNVSDPGVTLIELFAWMTDIMLYRMNQVPDLHYVKFMEMLGIKLQEPTPARVPITFWLTSPQATAVTIPMGTEVATTQTETKRPIVFTTDLDFAIRVPELKTLKNYAADVVGARRLRELNILRLKAGLLDQVEGTAIFSPKPQVDDALYFGFTNDLSHHILRFEMNFNSAFGAGIVPDLPPYEWEVSTGHEQMPWATCEKDEDTTRGMNMAGHMQIHLPKMGRGEQDLYWVRVRVKQPTAEETKGGMTAYDKSPRLLQLGAVISIGCTIPATHAQAINRELLGISDGTPGQRFQLQAMPILAPRKADETLLVKLDPDEQNPNEHLAGPDQVERWQEVKDFANSQETDPHFTLDSVTGELRFGPAIRQPNGEIKRYGRVPPRSATLIFKKYRHGGGLAGNVNKGMLNTPKTAIPYVKRVSNRQDAKGGTDTQTLEAAMMQMPSLLRARDRAVTAEDFEFLAQAAAREVIGRVKCLQPLPTDAGRVVPGQVYVLVIPAVKRKEGYLTEQELRSQPDDLARVTAYLDERRLLTTRLVVSAPAYHWVAIRVTLREAPGTDRDAVSVEIRRRLYHFLNPLTGGYDKKGWPFGRTLYVGDVYQCLQGVPNVLFIRHVTMYAANANGESQGTAVEEIQVVAHGVIASGLHNVEFV